ncbi:MAG: hypothetical protein WCG06_04985, partial [Candidatus Omnitrophota bacterium]
SDVGLDNADIAEQNLFKLLALNPDVEIDAFYLAGSEDETHTKKVIRSAIAAASRHRGNTAANHYLRLAILGLGKDIPDQQRLDDLQLDVLSENQPWIKLLPRSWQRASLKSYFSMARHVPLCRGFAVETCLIGKNLILSSFRSTPYREGNRSLVSRAVDSFVEAQGYYGLTKEHDPSSSEIEQARNDFKTAASAEDSGSISRLKRSAYQHIEQAVAIELNKRKRSCRPTRFNDQIVTMTAPLRLDFASGLGSDLFVVSMGEGGQVLNTAIKVNGQQPIKVTVRRIPEREIRIRSLDQNAAETITDLKAFQSVVSGGRGEDEKLLLSKAALIEAEIIPESLSGNLTQLLDAFAGGLEITTDVMGIPKGSGLGVSSILGMALLKALYQITDRRISDDELLMRLISLELRMHSLGGWQDPIGGAFGGTKWIQAKAGNPVPSFEKLELSDALRKELRSRLFLVFSGEPHFAGDPLEQIITGYLLKTPAAYAAMRKAQRIRDGMYHALREGNIDQFGALMRPYWDATIALHGPLATNPFIDDIFKETESLTVGGKVSGAGGGFMFLVAKKGKEDELREILVKKTTGTQAKLYSWDFDDDGLTVDTRTAPDEAAGARAAGLTTKPETMLAPLPHGRTVPIVLEAARESDIPAIVRLWKYHFVPDVKEPFVWAHDPQRVQKQGVLL